MNNVIFREKDRYSIFKGFLDCLFSLANRKKQVIAWENGDYSSYVEFPEVHMCFSDACEPILTWEELSNIQRSRLQRLYEMLENYDRYLPNRKKTDTEISKDPDWQKISEFAMQICQDLKEARYTS